MDMQELFVGQIVADVILCFFILYLSLRLGRKIGKDAAPAWREESLAEFRKLIQESREEAERFAHAMDDSCQTFRELASRLEEKELRLAGLIHEVQRWIEKPEIEETAACQAGEKDIKARYQQIIQAFKAGTAIKEIAQGSGLPEGEVALVIGLENIRRETAANGSSDHA